LSASGKGMFMIVQVSNPDRHVEHFHAIVDTLNEQGLIADKQCKDIARLRGASYDSTPFLNADAGAFKDMVGTTDYIINIHSLINNDVWDIG
jgi:hypothetical protein